MDNYLAIVKEQIYTWSDSIKTVWNVIDLRDGYVFDTFSRRCDAKAWVDAERKAKQLTTT